MRVSGGSLTIRRYLGVAIDYVKSGGGNETRYTFSDHLGSMDVIASASGTLLESLSFDAHGNRRDPTTWQGSAPPPTSTNIGFTGQEHVDSQSFIHFNGRIYDPQLGRMLQADPVQNPGSQGLNRYSYVANNPLTLTDPSGYSWFGDLLKIAAVVVIDYFTAGWASLYMGGGVIFGESTLTGLAIMAGGGFISGAILTGSLQGAVAGAFAGALFAGIGQGFDSWDWAHAGGSIGGTGLNDIGYAAKILAHGIAGGVMSELEGGKFGNGFLSAGVTEATGPAIDGLDETNHPLGQSVSAERVITAAVVGGTTSALTGGSFANGAITGAFSRAFNEEAAHQKNGPQTYDSSDPNYHRYQIGPTLLCDTEMSGCTVPNMLDAANQVSVPFVSNPPEGRILIPPLNDPIFHLVDAQNAAIYNITDVGHTFYPGQVADYITVGTYTSFDFSSFSFTQQQGIFLTTVGTGYAPQWILNDAVGYALFGDMHNQVQGIVAQKLPQARQ